MYGRYLVLLVVVSFCTALYVFKDDQEARNPTSFAHSAMDPQSYEYTKSPEEVSSKEVFSRMDVNALGVDGKPYRWRGQNSHMAKGSCTLQKVTAGIYCQFVGKTQAGRYFQADYSSQSGYLLNAITEAKFNLLMEPHSPVPDA